jgi:hypothetical protein
MYIVFLVMKPLIAATCNYLADKPAASVFRVFVAQKTIA